ncbi:MAG: CYTH domain-containing protein, partial [Bacteroidetes bacterium]|nr:CYTH domain-containing protein [Bacteroidota bacterium]
MAIEIERKFLIKNDSWKKDLVGQIYQQAYLSKSANKTVRIRIVEEKAFLTIKGKSKGISRTEFEYSIPVDDARIMINDLCDKPAIL